VSEGLAQDLYMAVEVGFEPVTVWMQGTELNHGDKTPTLLTVL